MRDESCGGTGWNGCCDEIGWIDESYHRGDVAGDQLTGRLLAAVDGVDGNHLRRDVVGDPFSDRWLMVVGGFAGRFDVVFVLVVDSD